MNSTAFTEEADLLRALVAIPSLNPMGQTGPVVEKAPYLENRLADAVGEWLTDRSLTVHRQTVSPGRDNLWTTSWASDPAHAPHYLFEVHLDTVPVDGMTIDPFGGEIRDGKLYARGACDNKGPMTAMMLALADIQAQRGQTDDPYASITLAMTVDEEHTFLGVQHLVSELQALNPPIAGAIVAEPTELQIVDAHKGITRCKVVAQGRAGHSSDPEAGRNAIYALSTAALLLEELYKTWQALPGHPRLGPPTLSVGRFTGGTAVNIIPDHAEMEVDVRFSPPWTPDEALDYVRNQLNLTARQWVFREVEITMEDSWVYLPALPDDQNQSLADHLTNAIEQVMHSRPDRQAVPFGTDASHLAESGIPSVVFGPGSIRQAHTRDEWIELQQVHQARQILCAFARGS